MDNSIISPNFTFLADFACTVRVFIMHFLYLSLDKNSHNLRRDSMVGFKFRSHYSYWKAIFIPNVPNSESCLYSICLRRKKSYSCFWKTIFCQLSDPQLQRILEKLGNHFNLNRQEKCLLVGRRWVILIQ